MSPNNASAKISRPAASAPAVHARADAGDITPEEAPLLVRSLLSAGLDTTVNGIGAAVYCLARFPDQLRGCAAIRRWRAMRSRRRSATKARCRPSSAPRRGRSNSAAIAIGEGEKVLMFLGAANRDPRRWENPDQLRRHPPHSGPCRVRLGHPYVRRPACGARRRRGDAGGDRAQGCDHRDHRPGEAPLQQHAARPRKPSHTISPA
jgi:hypothetical protein